MLLVESVAPLSGRKFAADSLTQGQCRGKEWCKATLCCVGPPMNDYKQAFEMCKWGLYGCPDVRQVDDFLFKHLLPEVREQVLTSWNHIVSVRRFVAEAQRTEPKGSRARNTLRASRCLFRLSLFVQFFQFSQRVNAICQVLHFFPRH